MNLWSACASAKWLGLKGAYEDQWYPGKTSAIESSTISRSLLDVVFSSDMLKLHKAVNISEVAGMQ
jgi:hypothetical protein